MLDAGFWVLGTGHQLLVDGYWMRVSGLKKSSAYRLIEERAF
jgi:hypothetical protein